MPWNFGGRTGKRMQMEDRGAAAEPPLLVKADGEGLGLDFLEVLKVLPVAYYVDEVDASRVQHLRYSSPQFEDLTGLAPGQLRSDAMRWSRRVHVADREAYHRFYRGLIGRSCAQDIEYRFEHSRNGWIWLRDRARSYYDAQRQLTVIHGVIVDVSDGHRALEIATQAQAQLETAVAERTAELKVALEQLRESEERHRQLVDYSSNGVAVLEAVEDGNDFLMRAFNRAALAVVGCPRREVVGRMASEAFPGLGPAGLLDEFRRVWRSGRPRRIPLVYYEDGHHSGWRQFYIYRLPSHEVVALFTDVTQQVQAERSVRDAAERLRRSLEGTIAALAAAVELRDPYTAGHQRRVTQLACAIAEQLGCDESTLKALRVAATLHDVGKMVVPVRILSKPGRLDESEMALIRTHAAAGAAIVADIDFDGPVREAIAQHHERLDGSGYPDGLRGEQIVREAQILAVADVVEAMVSHRPYRPALSLQAAFAELQAGAGTCYDPEACAACIRLFTEKGFALRDA